MYASVNKHDTKKSFCVCSLSIYDEYLHFYYVFHFYFILLKNFNRNQKKNIEKGRERVKLEKRILINGPQWRIQLELSSIIDLDLF